MGYYSDVRFNTTKEGYEKFKASLAEDTKSWLFPNGKPEVYDEEDGEVIFGWDDIKWYQHSYQEIDDAMGAYRNLRYDDVPFEYVRVGEECGDYEYDAEEDGGYLEPWKLHRHIEPMMTINVY